MSFYIVNHKVNDFAQWKKVYDEFESTREQFGIKEHYALQSADDPNHVLVVGQGELSAIKEFLHSEDLKQGMQHAGVSSEPQVFIGDNIK
jgi:hypothetical protein